jgi:hypothetical protein
MEVRSNWGGDLRGPGSSDNNMEVKSSALCKNCAHETVTFHSSIKIWVPASACGSNKCFATDRDGGGQIGTSQTPLKEWKKEEVKVCHKTFPCDLATPPGRSAVLLVFF